MALYDVSTSEKKLDPKLVAGGTLYADSPIGSILPFGGASDKIVSGWLLCDGRTLQISEYNELFNVIGTAFGGDGSTTFNIPDLRGEFLRGAGTNSHTRQGNGGNVGEHQDSTEILAYYLNNAYSMQAFGKDENIIKKGDSWIQSATSHSAVFNGSSVSQGGSSYTVRPTNTSVNYIIKAKMVAVPSDFLAKVDEAVEDVYGDIIPSDASASNKVTTQDMFKVITTPAMTGIGNSNGNIKNYIPSGYTLVKVEAVGYGTHQVFFDDRGYVFVFNIDSTLTSNWTEVATSASIAYKLYCVKFN